MRFAVQCLNFSPMMREGLELKETIVLGRSTCD